MLTLQQIKENPQYIIERLAVKGFDGSEAISNVMALDDRRKSLQFEADNIAADLKKKADSIGRLMKEGKREEADEAKKEVAAGKERLRELNDALSAAEADIRSTLLSIPNIPCEAVPEGKTAEDNVVEKEGGKMPELSADALPHWDLAKKYNL
ncbi:MAG: serine--tRNA ligase, partial [Duncaniella sp.]|nr:serine--tRNA ligase [Duncaniella sp.]